MNETDTTSPGSTGSRDAACSATPRTDAMEWRRNDEWASWATDSSFSRQLERELSAMTAERDKWREAALELPNAREVWVVVSFCSRTRLRAIYGVYADEDRPQRDMDTCNRTSPRSVFFEKTRWVVLPPNAEAHAPNSTRSQTMPGSTGSRDAACSACAEAHAILDADESKIIRNAKDGYPEGRESRELTLAERVNALCIYAADWKRWCESDKPNAAHAPQPKPETQP